MNEKEILQKLADIECQLSPENLTCDGELSRAQVRKRSITLMRAQAALIKQLGRLPTFQELNPGANLA